MLKTLSAALLAASVVAAPAFAGTVVKHSSGPLNARAETIVVKRGPAFHNHRHYGKRFLHSHNRVVVIKKHHHFR